MLQCMFWILNPHARQHEYSFHTTWSKTLPSHRTHPVRLDCSLLPLRVLGRIPHLAPATGFLVPNPLNMPASLESRVIEAPRRKRKSYRYDPELVIIKSIREIKVKHNAVRCIIRYMLSWKSKQLSLMNRHSGCLVAHCAYMPSTHSPGSLAPQAFQIYCMPWIPWQPSVLRQNTVSAWACSLGSATRSAHSFLAFRLS